MIVYKCTVTFLFGKIFKILKIKYTFVTRKMYKITIYEKEKNYFIEFAFDSLCSFERTGIESQIF